MQRPARRAVAVARHRPRHAARADRRVRGVPQRRLRRRARARSSASSTPTAASRCRQDVARERVISPESRLPDGLDARRRHRPRHRRRPRGSWGVRVPGRRQDRHHQRLQGRLVRRLLVLASSSACGSASTSRRRSAATPTAPGTRCRSGATSCGGAAARRPAAARSRRRPGCTRRRCAGLVSAAGRRRARLRRNTSRRATTCPAGCARCTRASIKQRVRRAVEGLLSGLGKRNRPDIPVSPHSSRPVVSWAIAD